MNGEYIEKNNLINELIQFEQTAASINCSKDYVDGLSATINRLKNRKPDLIIGVDVSRKNED